MEYCRYQEYLDRTALVKPIPTGGPPPKTVPRRSVLSEGMERLYHTNPAIAGIGLDNVGAQVDQCEAINKCLKIAAGIRGPANAARHIASEPLAY